MKNPQQHVNRLDLAAIRSKLASSTGPCYWRSLEEVAAGPEFQQFVEDEFPTRSAEWLSAPDRRDVLRFMAASFALAGLSACTKQPTERIVPYVRAPEELIPGRPLYYATSMPFAGSAIGLLVESQMGRPTKVEGNPLHPESLGAANAYAQASTLTLYDPDRSQTVLSRGRISSWDKFATAAAALRAELQGSQGAGLRILTQSISSPTQLDQMQTLLKALPQARWHQYEAVSQDNTQSGAQLAFGEPATAIYDFSKADVILSLDSDFLASGPGHLAYARQFIGRREPGGAVARLYVAEPYPSITGSMADHRLAVRAGDLAALASGIAQRMGVGSGPALDGDMAKWADAVAKDLQANRGAALVVAGPWQPASLHALAHMMNQALGAPGNTVDYREPLTADATLQIDSIRQLAADIKAGKVKTLMILGANPAYDAPADLGFAESMALVPLRIHLGLYADETANICHWHIPEAHFLESWGDTRAYDGTIGIQQPLIAPLYDGKSAIDVLAQLSDTPGTTAYDVVRTYWQRTHTGENFDDFWQTALHDGIIPNTAFAPKNVSAKGEPQSGEQPAPNRGIELVLRPDPSVWDGRFANNGWLQELPRPVNKLTWDNAACVSPAMAERLHLENGELIDLRLQGRTVQAPVWIVPGTAPDTVAVTLGYGRTLGGRVMEGVGFDAYALRTSGHLWHASGLEIVKTGGNRKLACTQKHHSMEDREPIRVATLADFAKNQEVMTREEEKEAPKFSIFPDWQYTGHAWGMTIDLNRCIGCNACVVACQAENNIPVVGKEQVLKGREMQWLRIDAYHSGSADAPSLYWQPVACVHCEHAPCEVVCPVAATVHSGEGLNQMVYNRCVGTRYCSNNCPYKVRRFNFLLYQDWETPSLESLRNPDVTVRSRGVMEKCSYCVQRIQEAKIDAERNDRPVRDGDVVTACQQTCPTQAILFGDLNDKSSRLAKQKKDPRNFSLLGELNTAPRTTYLGRLRNPNTELEGAKS